MDPDTKSELPAAAPASEAAPTLALFHYEFCPYSRAVRLALGELGIAAAMHEERTWEWRPEFLALNPAGEVPVLSIENGLVICGAYAIAEFLHESGTSVGVKPNALPLFPGDAIHRAEVRRLTDWFHGKLHRDVTREMLTEKVLGHVIPGAAINPDPAVLTSLRDNFRYHLTYIEHLAEHRNWLAGDALSYADFAAGAHLSLLDYLGEVPWEQFAAVKIWYQRLKSRPAFRPLLSARLAGIPPGSCYANLDF